MSHMRLTQFLLRRLALGLVTLGLLSVLIFVAGSVLPGNVGERMLGPFADPRAIAELNHDLGTDRPLLIQYADWVYGLARGDFGESFTFRQPVSELIGPALLNSAKLGVLAFCVLVPVSLVCGITAGLVEGTAIDRAISLGGLSAAAIPEFVWAVFLIVVFGLSAKVLPVSAQPPDGATLFVQLQHLVLPALCLVLVLSGYILRMARAGTIAASNADYTRTAVLKGLPRRVVIGRHIVRNALPPTVAALGVQIGYLFGGLVAVELIFNYNGIGRLVFRAAEQKDFPVLQTAVLTVGAIYILANIGADLIHVKLDPRVTAGDMD